MPQLWLWELWQGWLSGSLVCGGLAGSDPACGCCMSALCPLCKRVLHVSPVSALQVGAACQPCVAPQAGATCQPCVRSASGCYMSALCPLCRRVPHVSPASALQAGAACQRCVLQAPGWVLEAGGPAGYTQTTTCLLSSPHRAGAAWMADQLAHQRGNSDAQRRGTASLSN